MTQLFLFYHKKHAMYFPLRDIYKPNGGIQEQVASNNLGAKGYHVG